jgi:hypothetical protein
MVDWPTSPAQGLGLRTMSPMSARKKVTSSSTNGHSPNRTSLETPPTKKNHCETNVTTFVLKNLLSIELLGNCSQDQMVTISSKLLTKLLSQGTKESAIVVSENPKGVKHGKPPKGSTSTNPKKIVQMTQKQEEAMKRGMTTRSKQSKK